MSHPLNPPDRSAARDARLHDAATRTARVAAEWPRAAHQARVADLPPIRSGWAAGGAHSGHSDPTAAQALADDTHYPNHLADLTAARRDYLAALTNLERLINQHRPAVSKADRARISCSDPKHDHLPVDERPVVHSKGLCEKCYHAARYAQRKANA